PRASSISRVQISLIAHLKRVQISLMSSTLGGIDPVTSKVLYSRNVIFRELTSSPIVLQPDEKEKEKDVVQLPPTPERTEQRDHVGSNDEESSSSSDSSEEEEEQPQPQPLRRSSKLENKVVKCIFIGYSAGVKGYKLWDRSSQVKPLPQKTLYPQ
ncbi:hypothetical protein P3S59_25890, partial [Enterobacter hormaechei]|uniref:hypothetical protein n=1 Tax=Enterobacter hormaechei TaxID=158836 RepID=UPI0023E36DF2